MLPFFHVSEGNSEKETFERKLTPLKMSIAPLAFAVVLIVCSSTKVIAEPTRNHSIPTKFHGRIRANELQKLFLCFARANFCIVYGKHCSPQQSGSLCESFNNKSARYKQTLFILKTYPFIIPGPSSSSFFSSFGGGLLPHPPFC